MSKPFNEMTEEEKIAMIDRDCRFGLNEREKAENLCEAVNKATNGGWYITERDGGLYVVTKK